VKKISAVKPGAAVVATRSPYDIRYFNSVSNYIMAYELTPPAVEGIMAMLKGRLAPSGKPPADILKGM
jgi:hypothetical protein